VLRDRAIVCVVLSVIWLTVLPVGAEVNLYWQPAEQTVRVGDTVRIDLYAVSDTSDVAVVSAMEAIISYTPLQLEFLYISSDDAQYDWMYDGFPYNAPHDINKDLQDGLMQYVLFGQLGQPARIDSNGLLVSTFEFTAISPGLTYVTILESYLSLQTRIFDGIIPNYDIKGILGSAQITIIPQDALETIVEAKALDDETPVILASQVVTRTFDDYFYIEDQDRTSGIRVNYSNGQLPAEGTMPQVYGVIRSIDGERVIDADTVLEGCTATVPCPMMMNIRAITSGLSPEGLLIKTAGRVTSSSDGMIVISDGSGLELAVELHNVTAPQLDTFVALTGTLGHESFGPVLRVNKQADIQILD